MGRGDGLSWRVEVLGRTRLLVDGGEVGLTTAESRILSVLALCGPTGAAEARLLDVLWRDGDRPPTAKQSLHNHVSRLRRKAAGPLVERTRTGYQLNPEAAVDVGELAEAIDAVRTAHAAGSWVQAVETAAGVSGAVVGDVLDALPDDEVAASRRAALNEEVRRVEELGADAMLMAGRVDDAVTLLQRLAREAPTREVRWELLLSALRSAGRHAEALEVYHVARRALLDRHGTEPGARLRGLHELLLEPARATTAGRTDHPVGRDDDVDRILAALDEHGTVLLTGDAGIGKSTVLHTLGRRWDGPAVLVECQENPWAALAPVDALLERLQGPLQALGLPSQLADLRDPDHTERLDRPRRTGTLTTRAAEVIAAGLQALPAPLLVIDDLDRTGPTTRMILLAAAASAGTPTLLSVRGPVVHTLDPLHPHQLALDGLDPDALGELAVHQLEVGPEEAAQVGRWLSEQTGGHPLFATQLLQAAADRRPWADPAADALGGPTPPRSLTASLQRQLRELPSTTRVALDAAAVLGDPIDLTLLRRVVDVGQLDTLVDRRLLVRADDGQVRFGHSLLRRVAYDQVPPGRRQELHHAFGLLTDSPTRRAHHLARGVELDPLAAVAAMAAAGRATMAEQAYAEAADWFTQAAEHASDIGVPEDNVLDLRLESCDCARMAGRPGHAGPLLDLAEEVLRTDHVDLRRRATVAAVQLGEVVDPGPLQTRAAALVDISVAAERDRAWRARLRATGSILHSMTGEPERCRSMFLAALTDLDEGDDELACDVLPYAYMSLGHPDDLPRREELAARLLDAARRAEDPAAEWEANHLCWSTATMRGDGPGARRAVAECERLLSLAGDAGRRWSVGYMRTSLAATDGRDDDAERLAGETLAIGNGVAPGRAMSVLSAQLLVLRWRQGRLDELVDTIRYLLDAQPEIAAWQGAGSLILADVDPAAAGQLFDAAAAHDFAAVPRDFAWLAAMMVLAGGAVRLRDPDRAAVVAPHLAPYTDLVCWQGSCSFGPVARVAADVAELCGDGAAAELRTTADRLDRTLAGG